MNPDLDSPLKAAQAQKGQLQDIFGAQRGETSDFLSRFSGAIGAQPTTSAMAGRIGQELNLPQLRSNSQSLQNTLFNLPSTYSAATRGFDVNANQLSRIVGTKQAELAPAASLAQSNLTNAENTLNTRMGYEQQDQAKALLPFQSEQSMMSERLSRETTGYSNQMQGELDSIISKMNAGITLSEGEKNRAQQLAVMEKQFNNDMTMQKQGQQFSSDNTPPNTQIVDVGGRKKLINSITGQVIQDLGNTAAPKTASTIGSYYGGSSTSGGGWS